MICSSVKKLYTVTFWLIMGFSLFAASWHVLHGSIWFHTDIARDFLLINDVVVNHKLALIGPRSGGIPGVFHGPAWLYLNLPVFIFSHGNPIAIGWFWVFLFGCSVASMFFITQKLTNMQTAMIATSLYALTTCTAVSNLFNPFGALLFAPLYVFYLIRYFERHKFQDMFLAVFIAGIVIQFQMAWGVPILMLSLPVLVYSVIKNKKIVHFTSFGVLIIPLSTFFLFDLRHQFLQTKSVLAYIGSGSEVGKQKIDILHLFIQRLRLMAFSLPGYFTQGTNIFSLALFLCVLGLLILFFVKKNKNKSLLPLIFVYFYIGFWIITLVFKGTIWDYYYWPFLPLFCIVLAILLYSTFGQKMIYLAAPLFIFLVMSNTQRMFKENSKFFTTNSGQWTFFAKQAQDIYKDANGNFGWYVYTADQYGYSSKYAMAYSQHFYPNSQGQAFVKQEKTYLIIFPSTNPYTNENWWRPNQIKISKKPTTVFRYPDGSYVEKYVLNSQEMNVRSDPNLIQDMIFR